nr:hypothetical protein [Angustibacter aerolatus]
MGVPSVDWLAVAPALLPALAAVLVLALDAVLGPRRPATRAVTGTVAVVALLGALAALVPLAHHGRQTFCFGDPAQGECSTSPRRSPARCAWSCWWRRWAACCSRSVRARRGGRAPSTSRCCSPRRPGPARSPVPATSPRSSSPSRRRRCRSSAWSGCAATAGAPRPR